MKLIHLIPTLDIGGAEMALVRLIEHSTFDQEVITLYHKGALCQELQEKTGVKVTSLESSSGFLWKLFALVAYLKKKRPTHVQTWLYEADLYGLLTYFLTKKKINFKLFFNIRCSDMRLSFLKKLVLKFLALGSKFTTASIVNSNAGLRFHQKWGYKNLHLIANAFDTDRYCPDPLKRASFCKDDGIDPDSFIIGMVARKDPIKNHVLLLEAHKLLLNEGLNVHLVLVGKGVEAFAGKNILCFESCLDTSLIYPVFDVTVLPSLSEGFANVLAESMSCGVSAIATSVGDNAHIIGDSGYCGDFFDPVSLRDVLKKFMRLTDKEKKDMSQKARRRIVETYSFEKQIESYEKVYKERF